MRCVVTGGKGFIGSHLVEKLLERGSEVVVIDDESAPENDNFYEFEGAEYVNADICDSNTHELYKGSEVVFHLAARSRIQPAYNSPRHTFENNVIGTQSVLEASKKACVKRVIYSGSSSYYGMQKPPHREDMPSDCLNPYSLSKYQGEQLCKLYSRISNLETVVLRYFNVYGPREPLKGQYAPVVGIFKRQKAAGEQLTIVGDGEQRRDFTHVFDVVEANLFASFELRTRVFKSTIPHEIFNIGTGTNYSVNQVAEMVSDNTKFIQSRPGEARETLAENIKARLQLGWEPRYSLPDMIFSY